MAGFWNQTVALTRKNLIYHRRHLRSNLRLILFPVILFLSVGWLRRYLAKKNVFGEHYNAKMATEGTPLLLIPAAEFRAVKTNQIPQSNDLPDKSCRINGSCPAIILITGNNREFGESVAGNMFSNSSCGLNNTADCVFGKTDKTSEKKYYHLQSQCKANFTIPVRTQDGTEVTECLQGLLAWRKNYMEINDELYDGQYKNGEINEILAAYDFRDSDMKHFDVHLWYNTTPTSSEKPPNEVPVGSTLNMVWNAYLQSLLGPSVRMIFEFIGEMPRASTNVTYDFASSIGLVFFTWVILQLFPVILTSLVYEKQQKLATMMKMHGLGNAPYWLITYLYFLLIFSLYMVCFVVFGTLAGLTIFTLNSYSIQSVFYFIHINLLISAAFLLSTVFSSAKSASVFGFVLVFGSWLVGGFFFKRLIADVSFPKAAFEMGAYGMRWQSLRDENSGMRGVLIIMSIEWLVFLFMSYCTLGGCFCRSPLSIFRSSQERPPSFQSPRLQVQESGVLVQVDNQDINQEILKVEHLLNEPGTSYPIISHKLQKTYPARDGNPEKQAVKGLSLAVARGECFGLLGPNGAGKTSFISMMTGLIKPSSGTAYVGGLNLKTQMSEIHSSMGVCPQENLLWDTLTGREHLNFYGRLKNLKGANLSRAVDDALRNVNLLQGGDADKRVGCYSGGMKRRLSIAISLIGDPKVVYLDEPSTGLDPASRKMLWDAVNKAKEDKAIILTTHSMEEAEHLCDRIGIFVDGTFQCLGSPDELKDRYGGTYVFTMATAPENEKEVEDLVKRLSPNAQKTYYISGTQKFEVPKRDVSLSDVFLAVKFAKERFGVEAWDIADTTLEDVFVKVATESEASAS
ncbi:ABC transporter A family member 10 isoform X2 [Coffea arabica]|uniref:ABC transporter A family member 10 isoform X2 n=1 Tax=Coffea arabica TaxID=13443 RepID=A0A6P6XG82_COFAR